MKIEYRNVYKSQNIRTFPRQLLFLSKLLLAKLRTENENLNDANDRHSQQESQLIANVRKHRRQLRFLISTMVEVKGKHTDNFSCSTYTSLSSDSM